MQRGASPQYSSAMVCRGGGGGDVVAYYLSCLGTVVACDLVRRAFAELPRILPAYHEYSIDVVACGGAALRSGALGVPQPRAALAVCARDWFDGLVDGMVVSVDGANFQWYFTGSKSFGGILWRS
jgi:hypothetical protein